MSRDTMLRVFCYDVTSDVRRRKIARILEDSASRVQLSVFEARLTPIAVRNVVAKAQNHLGKGDSLRVYTIGVAGERHCEVFGSGAPIEADGAFWLL
jgi:CRISPR-associated protein Cas2